MLSKMPIKLEKVLEERLGMEILRAAIIAELDAINLYEQFALTNENEDLKKFCLKLRKRKNACRRVSNLASKNGQGTR